MTTYREKLEATAQLLRTPPQSVCGICPGPRIPSPAHAAVVGRKGLHPVEVCCGPGLAGIGQNQAGEKERLAGSFISCSPLTLPLLTYSGFHTQGFLGL